MQCTFTLAPKGPDHQCLLSWFGLFSIKVLTRPETSPPLQWFQSMWNLNIAIHPPAVREEVLLLLSTSLLYCKYNNKWEKPTAGNHMLSQLGLPASNRDMLTLIHSTGEVLSLARRRESTNTETFTLHCCFFPPPSSLPSLPPSPSFTSPSLLLPSLFSTQSVCLSPPLKAPFSLQLRPARCHFCCCFICLSV